MQKSIFDFLAKKGWPLAFVFCSSLILSSPSHGANLNSGLTPNAGSLIQPIVRERELNQIKPETSQELVLPTIRSSKSSASFTVKSFAFKGNTLYTSEQLSVLLSEYLNRSIDFNDLQEASARIALFYRSSGWVVKTLLPSQDIVNGLVTIEVIEARLGRVKIDGESSKRVKTEKILQTIYNQQKAGDYLNSLSIERGLALAGDLSGVSVVGRLTEGDASGETDLIVSVVDKPLITGEVGIDNQGSRSTGGNRTNLNVSMNSLLGIGDALGLNLINSPGSAYARLSEMLPLGGSGLKLGANLSAMRYHLITQDFSSLSPNGTSQSVGLEVNYPIHRAKSSLFSIGLTLDKKRYINYSQGNLATDYLNTPAGLNFNQYSSDSFLGGGLWSSNLSFSTGLINYANSPLTFQATDASTTQAGGRYSKVRYFVSREQNLLTTLSIFSSLSGQWSNRNLDSSEKFYLGGANGVRAYPTSEAAGSKAQLFNIELRERLFDRWTIATFYDYGRVIVNANNLFVGASNLNEYALKGAGLSLGFQSSSGASLRASLSKRIGNNPNPTSTGNDQDGSFVKNRIWLNANMPF